jgi:hypothetical protein
MSAVAALAPMVGLAVWSPEKLAGFDPESLAGADPPAALRGLR